MSDYSELREGVQALADTYKRGFPNLYLSRADVVDALDALLNDDGTEVTYEVWWQNDATGKQQRSAVPDSPLSKESAMLMAERLADHRTLGSRRRYYVRKITTTVETLS